MATNADVGQLRSMLLGESAEDSDSALLASALRQHLLRRQASDRAALVFEDALPTVFSDETLAARAMVALVKRELTFEADVPSAEDAGPERPTESAVGDSHLEAAVGVAEVVRALKRVFSGVVVPLTRLQVGKRDRDPSPFHIREALAATQSPEHDHRWREWQVAFANGIRMELDFAFPRTPDDKPLGLFLRCPDDGLVDMGGERKPARSFRWKVIVRSGDDHLEIQLRETFDAGNCLEEPFNDVDALSMGVIPIGCEPIEGDEVP